MSIAMYVASTDTNVQKGNISVKNTYINAYELLCESNKHKEEEWKPVGSGLSRHRIIPGHTGGEYTDDNCTYLTLDQHALAHWLLWKLYRRPQDHLAYKLMLGVDPEHYPSMLGKKQSEEHKAKRSAAMKGRKLGPRSEETRAKISAAAKGKKPWNKGKKLSEEHKASLSAANKGRKKSPEHIAKMSAVRKGKKLSEEHKASLSAARKGMKLSEETKAKISAARRACEAKKRASSPVKVVV